MTRRARKGKNEAMMEFNDDRQRQADLAEKRHEENMLALRTLIERTAVRG